MRCVRCNGHKPITAMEEHNNPLMLLFAFASLRQPLQRSRQLLLLCFRPRVQEKRRRGKSGYPKWFITISLCIYTNTHTEVQPAVSCGRPPSGWVDKEHLSLACEGGAARRRRQICLGQSLQFIKLCGYVKISWKQPLDILAINSKLVLALNVNCMFTLPFLPGPVVRAWEKFTFINCKYFSSCAGALSCECLQSFLFILALLSRSPFSSCSLTFSFAVVFYSLLFRCLYIFKGLRTTVAWYMRGDFLSPPRGITKSWAGRLRGTLMWLLARRACDRWEITISVKWHLLLIEFRSRCFSVYFFRCAKAAQHECSSRW